MIFNERPEKERRREADLACYSCRRRKVKCDHQRPRCLVCLDRAQECYYPERPLKPGPKLGSLKRPRKRTVQQANRDGASPESNASKKNTATTSEGLESPPALDPALESSGECAEALPVVENGGNDAASALGPRSNIHDLSFILHPAHEAASPEDKEPTSHEKSPRNLHCTEFEQACVALGTPATSMASIVRLYFDNMVTISLFQEPRFAQQLNKDTPLTHMKALLAAIAAYAARLCPNEFEVLCAGISEELDFDSPAEYFLALAFSLVDTALAECDDDPPSLRIIQALTIATHLQLTQGARGKAWRSLGTCIRLAYELNLHLVDAGPEGLDVLGADQWCWREEQRRVWWAIWEMDVYASTIRRTPPAIDWSQIEVLLPAADEHWFSSQPQPSCFLERDPIRRWKSLQESGNQSPKAWFLVVNSFMKQAQSISNPRSIPPRGPRHSRVGKDLASEGPSNHDVLPESATQELGTLENCLQCFTSVLPEALRYRNQYLSFEARSAGQLVSTRQYHCSIYNIYVMVQLTRLMIYRYDVFQFLGSPAKLDNTSANAEAQKPSSALHPGASDADSPSVVQYFEAADNILSIVTRSCDDHVRFINPFLSSTIWLAAAVQIFRQQFNQGESHRTLIRSKFEVLYMAYKQSASCWKIHTAMEQNLAFLALQLERYGGAKDSERSILSRPPKTPNAVQSQTERLTKAPSRRGNEGSVASNASPVDAFATQTPLIGMPKIGTASCYNESELPTSDDTSPTMAFGHDSASMNDMWALDGTQLRAADHTVFGEHSNHIQVDHSTDFLDSLLFSRTIPEDSFARLLTGNPDLANGLSLDLPTNIHGLLSGHSMY